MTKKQPAQQLDTATLMEKLEEAKNEAHNAKTISYANLAILIILLAFVIGVVIKQLGV